MELRQLRYVLAVARERSFTRAARRLRVSQSAISEQVAKLESEIGFALFAREGRGIALTDPGRAFLEEAERVSGEVRGLATLAGRLRGRQMDTVILGMASGMAPTFIPRLFPRLAQRAPGLRLDVLTASTNSIFRDLHEGRIDLGIAIEPAPARVPQGLSCERLVEVPLALVVPPAHRLAGRTRAVDVGQLVSEPVVMSELAVGYGEAVMALFQDLGIHPYVHAVADNIETMKWIVRQGRCVALMPLPAAQQEAELGLLRVLPIQPARSVAFALFRARDTRSARREAQLALVREVLMGAPAG